MEPKMQNRLKKKLNENHACYVLITCNEPTEDGKMQVEMTYEGDAMLAAYLLQDAQSFMTVPEDCFAGESSKITSIDC